MNNFFNYIIPIIISKYYKKSRQQGSSCVRATALRHQTDKAAAAMKASWVLDPCQLGLGPGFWHRNPATTEQHVPSATGLGLGPNQQASRGRWSAFVFQKGTLQDLGLRTDLYKHERRAAYAWHFTRPRSLRRLPV